ncbi:transcriptional regulator, Spx/MgsR family [Sphingomonas palmae]|uniref:Transcriptional regulator, Spx/MgsR family n=1 Tax=Sphingomonas palmae TaxID=1855283 RepID=A0A1H7PWZ3_9SPHN|nr:ArsC family reductase [Sphingomonas palmae]SEL39988.1 transcriptional regulator, Spx/MgsR family [Sphingomonas palmae]
MTAPVTMYGIPNCDTIKKARAWLVEHDVTFIFHDYRKDGLDRALLDELIDRVGWEVLLNRAGTTFCKLPEEDRAELDRERATALMLAQPGMIKRPVLVAGGMTEVGFKPDRYAALFG